MKQSREKNEREIRMAELRAAPEEEKMIVEGYAAIFEHPATHYGFTEIIDRSAFAGTEMRDVPMRYNHNELRIYNRQRRMELRHGYPAGARNRAAI
jgi:hypothetical protein